MDKNHADISGRIRKLGLDYEQLSKRITELKAPEGVKKWVGSQLKDVYEGTIPEIKSIKKEILNYLEEQDKIVSLRRDEPWMTCNYRCTGRAAPYGITST